MSRIEFRDDEVNQFDIARRKLEKALKKLEGYEPDLDLPLVEEVVRSAIYVKRGEQFLDAPDCSAATYAAVSDAVAKHAARMRAAIKELAASRAERLKLQSATTLVAEIKSALDKVIREG